MYEYDIYGAVDADGFAPRSGQPAETFAEEPSDDTRTQWDLDAEFEFLFQPLAPEAAEGEEPAPQAPPPPPALRVDRRRKRPRVLRLRRSVVGLAIAATTAAVTSTVSLLSAMVSYGSLRQLASPTAHNLAHSWPLLVYLPWLAGCLSVLNAAAHRRPGRSGWIAVVLFTAIATVLSIVHAPRTFTASAVAGLPPFSALASFLLLSRQITLLRPNRVKLPRQRKH